RGPGSRRRRCYRRPRVVRPLRPNAPPPRPPTTPTLPFRGCLDPHAVAGTAPPAPGRAVSGRTHRTPRRSHLAPREHYGHRSVRCRPGGRPAVPPERPDPRPGHQPSMGGRLSTLRPGQCRARPDRTPTVQGGVGRARTPALPLLPPPHRLGHPPV